MDMATNRVAVALGVLVGEVDGEEGQLRRLGNLEGYRDGVAVFRIGCGRGVFPG